MKILRTIRNFFNLKVLLCDLDGTLIVTKSGATFPKDCDDWQFKPHIKEAIQEYNPKNKKIYKVGDSVCLNFEDTTLYAL